MCFRLNVFKENISEKNDFRSCSGVDRDLRFSSLGNAER